MLDFYRYIEIDFTLEKMIKIVSIDPGIKNFAIRIERINFFNKEDYIVDYFEVIQIDENKNVSKLKLIQKLNDTLISLSELMKGTHFILIEEQLGVNSKLIVIFHHMLSYFINCGKYNTTSIISVNPKFKSKKLNFPRLNGKKLKKYTVDRMIELLQERNDVESLNKITSVKKQDDLADTKAMIESFLIELGI
jgi:hypothetical protein